MRRERSHRTLASTKALDEESGALVLLFRSREATRPAAYRRTKHRRRQSRTKFAPHGTKPLRVSLSIAMITNILFEWKAVATKCQFIQVSSDIGALSAAGWLWARSCESVGRSAGAESQMDQSRQDKTPPATPPDNHPLQHASQAQKTPEGLPVGFRLPSYAWTISLNQ